MNKGRRYSPEVRERAVRLLFEHEKEYESRWAATVSIASKIGCTPETLRSWVRRFEIDTGRRDGLTAEGRARLKALEKENKELRRANDIPVLVDTLHGASARTDRRHPARGERDRVLSATGGVRHGSLTQTNESPVNPGRFASSKPPRRRTTRKLSRITRHIMFDMTLDAGNRNQPSDNKAKK